MKLTEFAESTGRWTFFSPSNAQTLVFCILDAAEEVINHVVFG